MKKIVVTLSLVSLAACGTANKSTSSIVKADAVQVWSCKGSEGTTLDFAPGGTRVIYHKGLNADPDATFTKNDTGYTVKMSNGETFSLVSLNSDGARYHSEELRENFTCKFAEITPV